MKPGTRRKLEQQIKKSLRKAHLGTLADFPIYDDLSNVWVIAASCAAGDGIIEDFETKEEFALHERKLGDELVKFVENSDTRNLLKVVKAVKFMREGFRRLKSDLPSRAEDENLEKIMQFFERHAITSENENWTIPEIRRRLLSETGIKMEPRTLERWCEEKYGFPFKKGKSGRPRKK